MKKSEESSRLTSLISISQLLTGKSVTYCENCGKCHRSNWSRAPSFILFYLKNENLFMFMLMLTSTTENNSLNLVYYILVNFSDLEGRKHIIIIYEKNASAYVIIKPTTLWSHFKLMKDFYVACREETKSIIQHINLHDDGVSHVYSRI